MDCRVKRVMAPLGIEASLSNPFGLSGFRFRFVLNKYGETELGSCKRSGRW